MAIDWGATAGWIGGLTGVAALAWSRYDRWRDSRDQRDGRLTIHTRFDGEMVAVEITLRLEGPGEAVEFDVAVSAADYTITQIAAPGRLHGTAELTAPSDALKITTNPRHSDGSGWAVTVTLRLANLSGGSTPSNAFSGRVTIRATTISRRRPLISTTRAISARA